MFEHFYMPTKSKRKISNWEKNKKTLRTLKGFFYGYCLIDSSLQSHFIETVYFQQLIMSFSNLYISTSHNKIL